MLYDQYLVQGVFFQVRDLLEVAEKPGIGTAVVICGGLCRFLFSGVIERDPEHLRGGYRGHLNDWFGGSELTGILLTETELCFTKKYMKRKDTIQYVFTKQDDGIWIGKYNGAVTGGGFSRCLLTPVTSEFFAPPNTLKRPR